MLDGCQPVLEVLRRRYIRPRPGAPLVTDALVSGAFLQPRLRATAAGGEVLLIDADTYGIGPVTADLGLSLATAADLLARGRTELDRLSSGAR